MLSAALPVPIEPGKVAHDGVRSLIGDRLSAPLNAPNQKLPLYATPFTNGWGSAMPTSQYRSLKPCGAAAATLRTQIDLPLRLATEESEQVCSGLIHSWKPPGDTQHHTKRPHELAKTVFQLLAAHADFGWQCAAGLNRFEKYS